MKAMIPLISLLFLVSCGKVNTSGTQTVQLPNTRHDVVIQPDFEFLLERFYRMCVYENMNIEDAEKTLRKQKMDAAMERCAFEKLGNFISLNKEV